MKFSIKYVFKKCDEILRDLVTFTEEILNGKLHFYGVSVRFCVQFCSILDIKRLAYDLLKL